MATMIKNAAGEEMNVLWVEGVFKVGELTFNNLTQLTAYIEAHDCHPQYLK